MKFAPIWIFLHVHYKIFQILVIRSPHGRKLKEQWKETLTSHYSRIRRARWKQAVSEEEDTDPGETYQSDNNDEDDDEDDDDDDE